MPDLSSFPALDVLIGLAFLFFLLATACSAINELIASALGWRAKTLEDGVRSLLNEPTVRKGFRNWFRSATGRVPKSVAERKASETKPPTGDLTTAIFEHWGVQGLVRNPSSKWRRRRRPSYLPPRALSQAVVDTLARLAPPAAGQQGERTPWEIADQQLLAKVNAALAGPTFPAAPVLKKAAANAVNDLEIFRQHVEGAFDDAMTRAQGWYKRKVQVVLLILGIGLAVGLNVDAVHVGTRLWKDAALRSAVTTRATAAAAATPNPDDKLTPAQRAAKAVDDVNQLNLPVGWGSSNAPKGKLGAVGNVPGWIITIAALTLGAPFWFDVLSRLARLRGSGGTNEGRALSDKQPSKTS
jgi:hypothetical protein